MVRVKSHIRRVRGRNVRVRSHIRAQGKKHRFTKKGRRAVKHIRKSLKKYKRKGSPYAIATARVKGARLPKRGTGLRTGRAGKRRRGKPRTRKQRLRRHYRR